MKKKELHVVRYKKEGKLKQKMFEKEAKAKDFYNKCVRFNTPAIRFKESPTPWYEYILGARVKWLGGEMDLIWLLVISVVLLIAYELQGVYS